MTNVTLVNNSATNSGGGGGITNFGSNAHLSLRNVLIANSTSGGNCELSHPGQTITVEGVTIMAPLNLPATMPNHASLLFGRNLTAFLQAFTKDKSFQLDFTDDIQQGALITHDGEIKHARTREALEKAGV